MAVTLAPPFLQPIAGQRPAALPARFSIEPVIEAMKASLDQPLSLNELAEGAGWSAFHFHRLFRMATGIPPIEFVTTLRLQEAKRLLLTTSSSVTDICYDVGYASLGTFTARFTHLVGVSPGRLRHFVNTTTLPSLHHLSDLLAGYGSAAPPVANISGAISAPVVPPGPIFIGLFPKPIPQARPVAAAVLTEPGHFQIADVPDGRYYLLVAAVPWAEDPRIPSLAGPGILVGTGAEPLVVRQGRSANQPEVSLRSPRPTDPPLLSCLPLLLNQRLARLANSA